ncbi:hypothetical protein L6452_40319 [Arctium lappa]|uniref:Uncharacterized protein n=1 Tax=Arctium lappa TaxID=4217 RepID=A0ACB8XME6_ARCLA|nr:hypothetical protein L6452_40319 [Arctium lappa]
MAVILLMDPIPATLAVHLVVLFVEETIMWTSDLAFRLFNAHHPMMLLILPRIALLTISCETEEIKAISRLILKMLDNEQKQ